jgi:hypothetical protein
MCVRASPFDENRPSVRPSVPCANRRRLIGQHLGPSRPPYHCRPTDRTTTKNRNKIIENKMQKKSIVLFVPLSSTRTHSHMWWFACEHRYSVWCVVHWSFCVRYVPFKIRRKESTRQTSIEKQTVPSPVCNDIEIIQNPVLRFPCSSKATRANECMTRLQMTASGERASTHNFIVDGHYWCCYCHDLYARERRVVTPMCDEHETRDGDDIRHRPYGASRDGTRKRDAGKQNGRREKSDGCWSDGVGISRCHRALSSPATAVFVVVAVPWTPPPRSRAVRENKHDATYKI